MQSTTAVVVSFTMLLGFGVGWSAGCAGSGHEKLFDNGGSSGSGGSAGFTGPGSVQCPLCKSDSDCIAGETCTQFSGDTFCAPPCGEGGSCDTGRICTIESSYNGSQVSVCIPENNACAGSPPGGGSAGTGGTSGVGGTSGSGGSSGSGACPPPPPCDAGAPDTCGSLVGPSVSASCHSCSSSSSSCQANGCYGGWWCDTATSRCQAAPSSSMCPPTSCPPPPVCDAGAPPPPPTDGGGPPPVDAGPGTLTGSGGTVADLRFAVTGDTRPASEDDTAGYPTKIITTIYKDIQGATPAIPFVVSTGDYVYANPSGTQAAAQTTLYMGARAGYSGFWFPAMGNHECTGYTSSNCGPGSSDGVTNNYSNFLSAMLGPIGQTKPYYSVNINAVDGSWTAKFVFVAANAWDSAQSSWLSTTLGAKTTYTFVMRHEEDSANTAPGVTPSQSIISSNPLTLEIVGHSHTYEWVSSREAIVGNGGAPLTGGVNYGYALIQRVTGGNITVDMVDYMSGKTDSSFHKELSP